MRSVIATRPAATFRDHGVSFVIVEPDGISGLYQHPARPRGSPKDRSVSVAARIGDAGPSRRAAWSGERAVRSRPCQARPTQKSDAHPTSFGRWQRSSEGTSKRRCWSRSRRGGMPQLLRLRRSVARPSSGPDAALRRWLCSDRVKPPSDVERFSTTLTSGIPHSSHWTATGRPHAVHTQAAPPAHPHRPGPTSTADGLVSCGHHTDTSRFLAARREDAVAPTAGLAQP